MSPTAWGGVLLVLLSIAGASGRLLPLVFGAATIVWLACLRGHERAGGRLVLAVAILVRLPFLFGSVHSDDLHRYAWEGRIQLEGYSPYRHAPDDPALAHLRGPGHESISHGDLVTIYPPLAQMLFAGGALLGLEEPGLRNLALLLDLAVVAVLLSWLRSTNRPPGRLVLYAWCPLAVGTAATGHVDPLMLLFLAGFAWAWERDRPRTAAALLGCAILAKTVAVLLLPWLALRRARLLPVALLVVAAGFLPYLPAGGVLGSLLTFGREFAFNGSVFRVFEAIAPGADRWIVAALLASWTAWVALSQPRPAVAGILALAGLLVLSPTVHVWYLTWFLVLLPAVGCRPWTWPLVAWCCTAALPAWTYVLSHRGEPFRELFPLTWLEYTPPVLLSVLLVRRRWPRRVPPSVESSVGASRDFSVVIPARGEAKNLRTLLPAWSEAGPREVIVADLPTGDGTREICGGRPEVRYLPVEERGYGAAVLAGLAAAEGEFVVIADADHDRGPRQVRALLAPFEESSVGLVAAARTGESTLSPPQRLGNAVATLLIGFFWGRRFADLGPFRALRRSAWAGGELRDRGFGINVEMNVRALERGMEVREVALPAGRRRHGEDRISKTVRGIVGAGYGILHRLYRLRERSCTQPS